MCDTLILRHQGQTWFAKNSDREPAEPQRLLRLPAVRNDPEARLRTTYLDIPQAAQRHALVISQPSWIWGAEMGVNEHGVAIGNEAVFTADPSARHRAARHGPAAPGTGARRQRPRDARGDHRVVAALRPGRPGRLPRQAHPLRQQLPHRRPRRSLCWKPPATCGRRRRSSAGPSPTPLTLGHEFDLCSRDPRTRLAARAAGMVAATSTSRGSSTPACYPVGGAHRRCRINQRFLDSLPGEPDWHALFAALRHHGPRGDHFRRHNNRQVCMHAGSFWRPSQTTASLVARLRDDGPLLAATGTSAPCLGLFQPLSFDPASGAAVLSQPREAVQESPGGASRRCTAARSPTAPSAGSRAAAVIGWNGNSSPTSNSPTGRAWQRTPQPGTPVGMIRSPCSRWRSSAGGVATPRCDACQTGIAFRKVLHRSNEGMP